MATVGIKGLNMLMMMGMRSNGFDVEMASALHLNAPPSTAWVVEPHSHAAKLSSSRWKGFSTGDTTCCKN